MDKQIRLSIEYNPHKYSAEEVNALLAHYAMVLEEIGKDPTKAADQIAMCTDAERKEILNVFNDTAAEYPKDKTVIDLFEEQVRKTPDQIAFISEDTEQSYAKLNEQANRIAFCLIENGVKPNDVVMVYMPRNELLIPSILGVLKAGATYLPTSTDLPKERVRFMC